MSIMYSIKMHNVWNCPDDAKKKDSNAYMSCTDLQYGSMTEVQFIENLKDILDIADYPLTPKNIKCEFRCETISDACINRIIKYYKFRKMLYDKIMKNFVHGASKTLMKQLGADRALFKYNIPYYGNTFSIDDPDYTGNQILAFIEIGVHKYED